MNDCLTTQQIERYRSGSIGYAEELLALDAHMAGCPACRAAVLAPAQALVGNLASKLAPSARSSCLEFTDRARYVDAEMDRAELEVTQSHLEGCAACSADVEALRTFAEELKRYDWSAARQAAAPGVWWRRLFPADRSGVGALRTWQWGTAATVLLFVVLGYGIIVRPAQMEVSGLRNRLARERRQNDAIRRELARTSETNAATSRRLAALDAQNKQIARQTQQLTAEIKRLQAEAATVKNAVPVEGPVLASVTDNGRTIAVDTRGELTGLTQAPQSVKAAVSAALAGRAPSPPAQIARLVGSGGTLMGSSSSAAFALRAPVSTAVREARPVFRWRTLPGAVSYAVTLVDDEDQLEATSGAVGVSSSGPVVEWVLPASAPPLKRGRVYRWYVVATRGDGTTAQSPGKADAAARFIVLPQTQDEALRKAEGRVADSHLARGTVYVQLGLLDLAEEEFESLRKENPTSALVRKLLDKVRALRR
jgi:type II secretory pathway component PulM